MESFASSWGTEFVAGGLGGMAGVVSGHPLDTLRVRLQQPAADGHRRPSALRLLRAIVAADGPSALYRGMAAPLATVSFQNAVAFQVHAVLSRAFDSNKTSEPPSYRSVALGGVGTGALQSLMLTPVELVKIRLQVLQMTEDQHHRNKPEGPVSMARKILKNEGARGLYRGLLITMLRESPALGIYFWTYEYAREKLHPGCRRSSEESLGTMCVAGGLAGVASWLCSYPLDVVKSRLQAQSVPLGDNLLPKYHGIVDCFSKSVQEEGYGVLWHGLGTAVARAFVVNATVFSAYELALRFFFDANNKIESEKN